MSIPRRDLVTDPAHLADLVTLSLAPYTWRRAIGPRLRAGESPRELLRALAPPTAAAQETLGRLPGLTRAALDRAHAGAIQVIAWSDTRYPPMLAALDDPPPVLWVRGDVAALADPAVALVGSRAGSAYATTVAASLAGDLAGPGVVVISGLARGIDAAAHRGALAAGGGTVAVLGSGVDVVYPPEHRPLASAMATSPRCALVSELAPGTRPLQWFFPLRNRIISGLSRAVVIIEAGERSGSLITARWALEQGRNVLAVPGNVLGGRNRGGHALLRDGAKLVESADDILDELGCGALRVSRGGGPDGALHTSASFDPVLAGWVTGDVRDLDEISAQSGLDLGRLLPRLLELELAGRVGRAGGGRFIRLDRSC